MTIDEKPGCISITMTNGLEYYVVATYEDAIEAINKKERAEEMQEALLVKIKEEYKQ